MTKHQFFKISIYFTLGITTVLDTLLLYQYFSDGIPSHHFLARKEMPLVSNAWGIVTIPAFTWFLVWRIAKRIFNQTDTIEFPKNVLAAFSVSLVFGVALGLSIQYGFKTFTGNVPIILFTLALFFRTYRAECFLGFVLGLTYFVGGVLPIVVGSVFLALSAITYLYIRSFALWIVALIFKKGKG